MQPLSVGRLDNAFHPATGSSCHDSEIHVNKLVYHRKVWLIAQGTAGALTALAVSGFVPIVCGGSRAGWRETSSRQRA
jgi:hypothetical protein